MKLFKRIDLLANADVLDRLLQHTVDRQRRTAACVAIKLGENDTGDVQRFVKTLRNFHRFLAGHAVGDEQDFVRLDRSLEPLELVHHVGVDLQPSRGIDDHHAVARPHALVDTRLCNLHDILGRAIGIHGHVQLSAQGFKLVDGGWAVDVGRDKTSGLVFRDEPTSQLGCSRRLSRSLQADHHHDCRRDGADLETLTTFTEHRGKFVVHDLDQLLCWLDRFDLQYANSLLLDALKELARKCEVDVRLKQDPANFAQAVLDIRVGENATSAKLREHTAQFV